MPESTTTATPPKHAAWWDREHRGRLLGYGLAFGRSLAHVQNVKDHGPGAVQLSTLCGGLQPMVWLDSGLDVEDEATCTAFKMGRVRGPQAGDAIERFESDALLSRRYDLCSRCADRATRAEAAR